MGLILFYACGSWAMGVSGGQECPGLGQVGVGPALSEPTSHVSVSSVTKKQQRLPSLEGTAPELTQGGPGWGELPPSWTGGHGEDAGKNPDEGRECGQAPLWRERHLEEGHRACTAGWASGVRAWGPWGLVRTQSSCLGNPRTGESGGLPPTGSHRVGHPEPAVGLTTVFLGLLALLTQSPGAPPSRTPTSTLPGEYAPNPSQHQSLFQ